jgi:hypothetical protein
MKELRVFQRITYWAFTGYFIKLPGDQFLSLLIDCLVIKLVGKL